MKKLEMLVSIRMTYMLIWFIYKPPMGGGFDIMYSQVSLLVI